jgi:hypothetical protein
MMAHNDRHEELLEQLLTEARDPRGGLASSEFAGCAECAQIVEEWMSTESELVRTAQNVREALTAARGEEPSDGGVVERVLGTRLAEANTPRRGPWRLLAGGLSAAAALILAVLWIGGSDPGPEPNGNGPLGSGRWELVEPIGEVEAYTRFSWKGPELPGGWFELSVLGPEPESHSIKESGEIEALFWVPLPDETATWPETIRWELRVFNASGIEDDRLSGEASRSSRH